MESQDNNSISIISNKDNYYRFDNYGNIMADSIEDLLYDRYTIGNEYKEDHDINNKSEKSDYIPLSSSDLEEEEKRKRKDNEKKEKKRKKEAKKEKEKKKDMKNKEVKKKIIFEKNINQYRPIKNNNQVIKKNITIKSNNSSKDLLNLIDNKGILSPTDDKFLESNIPEDNTDNIEKIENIDNIVNLDNKSTDEDKFMKTLEGNDIYNTNKGNKEIKSNDKEDILEDLTSIHNNNANDQNIKNNDKNNIIISNNISDNYEFNSKKNSKDNKNIIIYNRNGEDITESTKVNSKKSNTLNYLNPDFKNLKNYRTIQKIQLNNPSNTVNKKIKINKNNTKLISNKQSIKVKKNLIKINLNDKKNKLPIPNICYISKLRKRYLCNELIPKKPRLFITKTYNSIMNNKRGPLLTIVNDYYFCTKEIGVEKNMIRNEIDDQEYNYNGNNDNNNNIESNEDSDRISDYGGHYKYEKKDKKRKNKTKSKNKSKSKKTTKIKKIKNKDPEMFTELELDKNHNPQNIRIKINNPFYPFYQFVGQNHKTIQLNKLIKNKNGFLNKNLIIRNDSDKNNIKINNRRKLGPLKIKRATKTNSLNNLYTTKNINISTGNDYNNNYYFNNKEIRHAIGHTDGRVCPACITLKTKKIDNKSKIRSFESYLKKNNNYLKEEINRNKNISINENKNNCHSYNKNSKRIRLNRQKSNNNISSSSISSKYTKVINIDFPVLNSYFH